jgi:phosphoribosylanthranilate isomerase
MSRVRIKICGLTHAEHVAAAVEADADLIGLVLWPSSPRHVSLETAVALATIARRGGLETVALVVDPDDALLAAAAEFDRIQFHGSESCASLAGAARPTIKGFSFDTAAVAAWARCPNATWLLIDGPRGGGGEGFDHAAFAPLAATLTKPWLLAGGLNDASVGSVVASLRPFGVDVSSGVERSRGVKDPERIRAFCRAVRDAEG